MNKASIMNFLTGMFVITVLPALLTLLTGFMVLIFSPLLFFACYYLVKDKYLIDQRIIPLTLYFAIMYFLLYSFYPGNLAELLLNESYLASLVNYYSNPAWLSFTFSYLGVVVGSIYSQKLTYKQIIINILAIVVILNIPPSIALINETVSLTKTSTPNGRITQELKPWRNK